jgi:hypothetical protein
MFFGFCPPRGEAFTSFVGCTAASQQGRGWPWRVVCPPSRKGQAVVRTAFYAPPRRGGEEEGFSPPSPEGAPAPSRGRKPPPWDRRVALGWVLFTPSRSSCSSWLTHFRLCFRSLSPNVGRATCWVLSKSWGGEEEGFSPPSPEGVYFHCRMHSSQPTEAWKGPWCVVGPPCRTGPDCLLRSTPLFGHEPIFSRDRLSGSVASSLGSLPSAGEAAGLSEPPSSHASGRN